MPVASSSDWASMVSSRCRWEAVNTVWLDVIYTHIHSFRILPVLFVHMFLGVLYLFPLCLLCVLPCLPVLCPCCSLFPLLSWFNLLLFILFSSLFLLCLVGLLVFFAVIICLWLLAVFYFWGEGNPTAKIQVAEAAGEPS